MIIPKVLYFSDVDISTPGGAQESMKILLEELSSTYEIYLIGPNGEQINKRHIVLNQYENFILRGKRPLNLFSLVVDIYKEIKKVNPNIIHIQMPSTLVIINFLLSLRLINKDIKIVYTDRGVYGKYGKITTISINGIIKRANKIVTTTIVNKKNYQRFFKAYVKYQEKFEVIYNTAGRLFDNYNENKRAELRTKYHIKDDQLVIGFCGRYSKQKNWSLASKIIKICSTENNIKSLVVLGSDGTQANYDKAVKYLNDLKTEVGDNKVLDFINISNKEMADLYYLMDCFILTSKWESFGRTAIEAMARQNAVIGTDVDGLTEVIGRKEYIINNEMDASSIVNRLLKSNEDLVTAKDFFYNRYHSHFGYKRNVQMYKELYDEILI